MWIFTTNFAGGKTSTLHHIGGYAYIYRRLRLYGEVYYAYFMYCVPSIWWRHSTVLQDRQYECSDTGVCCCPTAL